MKLQLISDLHTEFYQGPNHVLKNVDIVVDLDFRFFVSDQTKLIEEKQPRLWLHGHSHVACDYTLGNTRVVCNPYGYPHERNGRPYPQVVLEIPGRKPTGVIA